MATRKQETESQAKRDRKIGEEGGSWQIETSGALWTSVTKRHRPQRWSKHEGVAAQLQGLDWGSLAQLHPSGCLLSALWLSCLFLCFPFRTFVPTATAQARSLRRKTLCRQAPESIRRPVASGHG